jgi:hypothetical protein
MQTWKKKLVVSQIALACTLAIASQANAKDISGTTYNTFGYDSTVHPGIMAMPTGTIQTRRAMVISTRSSTSPR